MEKGKLVSDIRVEEMGLRMYPESILAESGKSLKWWNGIVFRHCNMTKTISILITILGIMLSGCSQPKRLSHPYFFIDSIESKILKFDRVAKADTTIARFSGFISGRECLDTTVLAFPLMEAVISATDTNGRTYFDLTDLHGKYQFSLPASIYRMTAECIQFNTIIIYNVRVENGDVFEFNAELGQSASVTDSFIYEVLPDKCMRKISNSIQAKKKK
jgi:hypothetical protein